MNNDNIIFPHIPQRLRGLEELAENLWWSWNPAARMVFKTLNRQIWKESVHNPDKTLRELSAEALAEAARDNEYLRHYDLVLSRFRKYLAQNECAMLSDSRIANPPNIAYFSAEYGLHHSLPFYAGGLGFLAGDYIKECSDLAVPLVAIGFMYPDGYVLQRISENGWQKNMDQYFDREVASITKVFDKNGRRVVVKVPVEGISIYVAVWQVMVGRIPLYLLDTDIEQNDPWNREISARLYGGDIEQRLRQEIVLGIGGSEVLDVLGIRHGVMHLNEGHAAFALLEKIMDNIKEGKSYEDAAALVKKTTVFTTHTPVPAGHDVFPFHLIEKYFHKYWEAMGLDRDRFMQLGVKPDEPHAGFNMTAFAMKNSGYLNAVSRKHGEVVKGMWQSLWPEVPENDIPIDYVTNGVHVPTWIEPKMELLFNKYLGSDWLRDHDNQYLWELIDEIPDEQLWETHYWLKMKLIDVMRERARQRWANNRVSSSLAMTGGSMLDPSVLTIGFARRFATYKRADLIFQDPERLKKILNDRWRPVQIIFAGKAHPDDNPGKTILQKIFNAARDPEYGGRIAFIEDYGEQLAQYMVHGVDVWLNNPLPPLEASGTSGMKAAINGVPSLSIMDGWWLEGYNGKNGWAFGHGNNPADRDAADAQAIYDLLENEIVPTYYKVTDHGVPGAWVRIMKESIKSSAARFSARRMVVEYLRKFYIKAMQASR
jgi:starch phosphorylase